MAALPAIERFRAKTRPLANGCIVWTGARDRIGYAHFRVERRTVLAHRWAFEQAHGVQLPARDSGLELDHLCGNRACVNIGHLELVTHAENVRRGRALETTVARQRSKTHCPAGHPYDEGNTYYGPARGERRCRRCRRERKRAALKEREPLSSVRATCGRGCRMPV